MLCTTAINTSNTLRTQIGAVSFLWLDDCVNEVCSDEHVVCIRGSLSTLKCSVGLEEAHVLLAD